MLTLRRLVPVAVALAFLSAPLVATAKKPPVPLAKHYTVVNLTLGGTNCRVLAMNDGAAVGSAHTPGDAETHAFVWTEASGMVDLGTLGGTFSAAGWHENGRVIGVSTTANDAEFHAFLWTAAT